MSGPLTFLRVEIPYTVQGGARRDGMGCTLRPSGRVVLNIAASEAMLRLVERLGLAAGACGVALGVNVDLGLVALYPADLGQEGIMPLQRAARARNLYTHIGPVFRAYPHLRPAGARQCAAAVGTDAAGRPCLVLSLQTAMVKRHYSRTDQGPASG